MRVAQERDPVRGGNSALRVDTRKARLRRMRVGVIKAAERIEASQTRGGRRSKAIMVTLTYKGVHDWRPNHIKTYIKSVREWMRRKKVPCRFVWVCELQQRGAPHYHIVFWLPKGISLPFADRRGWWPHGMSNQVEARKPVGYLVKYASKGVKTAAELCDLGHEFPRGCRIHACGGLDDDARMDRRWTLSPGYVRDYWDTYEYDVRPCVGGGWVSRKTGEWRCSSWMVTFIGDHFVDVEEF